jgi:hypothetical protein
MQRSPAQRILAGLFGLWMIVTVSGVALQACPEHGGGWMGGAGASTGTHDAAMPTDADMAAAMPMSHGHDASRQARDMAVTMGINAPAPAPVVRLDW